MPPGETRPLTPAPHSAQSSAFSPNQPKQAQLSSSPLFLASPSRPTVRPHHPVSVSFCLPLLPRPHPGEGVLYKLSDASGGLSISEVARGDLKKDMLSSDDVYMVDLSPGAEVIIWVGSAASQKERGVRPHPHPTLWGHLEHMRTCARAPPCPSSSLPLLAGLLGAVLSVLINTACSTHVCSPRACTCSRRWRRRLST